MSQFSFNPNILPPNKSIHPDEHRQHVVAGIIVAVLAIGLGITYYIWGTNSSGHLQTTVDVVAQIKAEQQINNRAHILAQLSRATTTVTAAQKQQIINQLNNR